MPVRTTRGIATKAPSTTHLAGANSTWNLSSATSTNDRRMAAEPTSTGTRARRSGGLATTQRLASATARTIDAVTTSVRCTEST